MMLPTRPLLLVAFTGLLAASCSSAVVPTPYGAALAPQPVLSLAPAAAPSPVDVPVQSYDVAPRRDDQVYIAYDVAPRRDGQVYIADDVAPTRLPPQDPPPAAAPAAPEPPPPPATKVALGPLPFISQTVNNCGPASVAEVLTFWGLERSQGEVQSVLRGDGNPYGMTPAGVPSYMASLGMNAVLGTGGTQDLIKELLRAGFPVIVNQTVSGSDPEFHYRPIQGFDDAQGIFVSSDPLIGPQYTIGYGEFDQVWAYTGHRFMVLYPPDKEAQANAALAAGKWDPAYAEGGGQALPWSAPSTGGPAPITTPVIDAKPTPGGWYSGPLTVGFRATDQSGFGVANTSYAIDNQPLQLYRGQFTMKDSGKHVLTFHSVNFNGSREADKSVEIDIGPPSTSPEPGTPAVASASASPTAAAAAASAAPKASPSAPAASATPAAPPASGYSICPLYNQNTPSKVGAGVAIRLQLCDAAGKNLSNPSIALTVQSILGPANTAKPPLPSFRYVASLSGYEADEPGTIPVGSYALYFTAAGDTGLHMIIFRVA